ncbi:MAG TPA: DNA-directed RNA polymerase [Candidatus Saccharimonadales bacterium]|nr:DNA-directed RNA polymerase [Candidatus Saccharimonadales bacterium]
MFYVYTIKDTISIPPAHFGEDLNKAAETILRKRHERLLEKDVGIVLAVFNVRNISDGFIMPGDPSTHHDVTFDMLAFNLDVGEILMGEVSELVDFGCFVRLGPIDGLVHLSQITNDFITHDRKAGTFVLRNSGRTLKKGDVVYVKVSTISLKNNIKDTKIALTMRPDGLGKYEWAKEPIKTRDNRRDSRGGKPRGRR